VFLRGKIIYHLFIVNLPPKKPNPFMLPATYQITVQGWIDPIWNDHLEKMTTSLAKLETGTLVATLHGKLSDQSALSRVLCTLYELNLTVISVVRLEEIK
jgi:hypothetical protein